MSFIRQAGLVAAGVAGGQIVILGATPYLARIYTPEDFGQYAVFTSILTILLTLSCLRYEVAIPVVPEEDIDKISIVALAAALLVGFFTFILLSTKLTSFWSSSYISLPELSCLLVLATVFSGWLQVAVFRSIRSATFGLNFCLRVTQPVVFVTFAWYSRGVGLIAAHVAGLAVAALVGLIGSGCIRFFSAIKLEQLKTVALRNKEYPLYSLPTAILDSIALALPVLVISSNYGDDAAGNFSQVQRIIAAPLLLTGIAVGQVFFRHSGALYRSGVPVGPLLWRTVFVLSGGGGCCCWPRRFGDTIFSIYFSAELGELIPYLCCLF